MSGIVGSKLNIRGSGRIAKLGTDGQVLTSSGAGVQANYEDAAGGGLDWQSVVTASTFTAVAGNGYPVNTTSNACTVTLPASASVGDEIIFTDYARNFATNALTINPNSLNYQGNTTPQPVYDTAGESIHIVYVDATKGWVPTYDGAVALETPQTYDIDFLVVAGGGGGGSGGDSEGSGGGGGGGYRTSTQTVNTSVAITVTVGDGGPGGDDDAHGTVGDASSISGSGVTTITSAGGGYGAFVCIPGGTGCIGGDGGNGGGNSAYFNSSVAGGNSPSTSPAQGDAGGIGFTAPSYGGGGGGGIGGAGAGATSTHGGNGGAGVSNSISGSATDYDGGGGGGTHPSATAAGTATDGGGGGGKDTVGTDGTVNTGGGGGGAGGVTANEGGDGGKGVVVLSMPDGDYSSTTTGSPTVATGQGPSSNLTTLVFTGTGSYTT